jgi:hypothetical protein
MNNRALPFSLCKDFLGIGFTFQSGVPFEYKKQIFHVDVMHRREFAVFIHRVTRTLSGVDAQEVYHIPIRNT